MSYTLTFKPDFMKDFIRFGKNDQSRISRYLGEIEQKPNIPRGDTIKRLKYTDNLWRYRFANQRIIYAVFPEREAVMLLAIGLRDQVYDRLNYNPDAPNLAGFNEVLEKALNPDQEAPDQWGDFVREEELDEVPLTYIFTTNQLAEWSIPEEYHPLLMACRTEEALLDCDIPDFYKERIIDLMSTPGRIEEIVQQPTRVLDDVKALQEVSEGKRGLLDFLLFLDQEQESLVDWSLRGPTLVKGGAGSGKSTIALYRARALCQQASQQLIPPKILFATYTNSLVRASEQLLDHLLGDVKSNLSVSTVDSLARKIVADVDGKPNIHNPDFYFEAIRASKYVLEMSGDKQFLRFLRETKIESMGDDYLNDEFRWIIQGRGIKTIEEYLQTDRRGRGYGFNENMRRQVWKIYVLFLKYLEKKKSITWEMLRGRALEIVEKDLRTEDKYDFVLIDEAQDLSPVAIKLCLALCKAPAGVFLTADAGQSIYNSTFSWSRVHEDLNVRGRTRILKRNYRTTREIATAVNQILVEDGTGDAEVLDQFYVHSGPKPSYFEARDEEEMLYWTYQSINSARQKLGLPLSAVAVLSPTNRTAKHIAQKLSSLGLPIQYTAGRDLDITENCVKSITIHAAKGLEFPVLAMPYLEEGYLPNLDDTPPEELEVELSLQRRLCFVGCSRSMRRLFVAYRKDHKSRFIDNLDKWSKGNLH